MTTMYGTRPFDEGMEGNLDKYGTVSIFFEPLIVQSRKSMEKITVIPSSNGLEILLHSYYTVLLAGG